MAHDFPPAEEFIPETEWAPWAIATYHPSALLRMPEEAMRREARELFTADLGKAAAQLRG